VCAGKDSSRPSKGRVARDLVASAFRHSGVRRVRVLCCSTSRNPEPRSAESAQSRARSITEQSQPSIQRGHVVRDEAPRLFSHRDSEAQGAAPSYPETRSAKERPGPGPTTSPSEFRTVRSERDAWRQIKPSRRFTHRDLRSKDQPLPIHERRKRL
jgi:hypothetical protein